LNLLFDRAGLWQARIEAAHTALKSAKEKGDKKRLSSALNDLGVAYFLVGETGLGLDYCKKALKIAEEISSKKHMANALGNIGIVLRQKGELDKALEHHQKALKIFSEINVLSYAEKTERVIAILEKEKL
jgi:tetratricopeptide (TPR) repeat protein